MEPSIVYDLAHKCREAYQPATLPDSVRHEAPAGVEFRLWEEEDRRVVAFAGTDDFDNLLTDLEGVGGAMLAKDHLHGGRFHRGFMRAFLRAYPKIFAELFMASQKHGDKPLRITGHSLGGAFAIQLAEHPDHRGRVAEVATFGAPRCCGPLWRWKARHGSKAVRVVLDGDIVPRLLLWRPYILHYGRLWFIDHKNEISVEPSFFKRAAGFVFEKPSGYIGDHSINSYCRALGTGLSIQKGLTEDRRP